MKQSRLKIAPKRQRRSGAALVIPMRDELQRRRRRTVSLEVVNVLSFMGGAGHIDAIVQVLAAHRRQKGRPVAADIEASVLDVLTHYEDTDAGDPNVGPKLFFRKFGPEARRWELLPNASRVDLPKSALDEVETILAEIDGKARGATDYDDARRRVIAALGDGERCSAIDVLILDELESRARAAARAVLQ